MGGCQVGIAYRENLWNWYLLVSLSFWTFAWHNTILKYQTPDYQLLPGGSQKFWGFNFCTHFSQKWIYHFPKDFCLKIWPSDQDTPLSVYHETPSPPPAPSADSHPRQRPDTQNDRAHSYHVSRSLSLSPSSNYQTSQLSVFWRVRNPRIFFPLTTSTKTVTTTAASWTFCYVTAVSKHSVYDSRNWRRTYFNANLKNQWFVQFFRKIF